MRPGRAARRALLLAACASLAFAGLAMADGGPDLVPAGSCGTSEVSNFGQSPITDASGMAFDACFGRDPSSGEQVFIWAYQDPSTSAGSLMDSLSTDIAAGNTSFYTVETLAGTRVLVGAIPGGGQDWYIFAANDAVYIVEVGSKEAAARAIQRIGAGGGGGGETELGSAVPGPGEISLDPVVIATSAAAAAGFVVAVPFPGTLFNTTLEENYAEVAGWFRRFGRGGASLRAGIGARLGNLFETKRGIAAYLGVAALIYGFLSPGFGFNLSSLLTVIGLWAGLGALALIGSWPARRYVARQLGEPGKVHVRPAGLVIAVVCVLVTRITEFQPGYLYGLVAGYVFTRPVSETKEGPAVAIDAGGSLALAVIGFIGLGLVRAPFPGGTPQILLPVSTAMAAIVVGGVEDVLFGLIPIRFMPGQKLLAWNRLAWAVLLGVATFAFLHVILNPATGYLANTTVQGLVKVIVLFVVFGLASVAFWAYFRYRKPVRIDPDHAA